MSARIGLAVSRINPRDHPTKEYLFTLEGVQDYKCAHPGSENGERKPRSFVKPLWPHCWQLLWLPQRSHQGRKSSLTRTSRKTSRTVSGSSPCPPITRISWRSTSWSARARGTKSNPAKADSPTCSNTSCSGVPRIFHLSVIKANCPKPAPPRTHSTADRAPQQGSPHEWYFPAVNRTLLSP